MTGFLVSEVSSHGDVESSVRPPVTQVNAREQATQLASLPKSLSRTRRSLPDATLPGFRRGIIHLPAPVVSLNSPEEIHVW